MTDKIEPIDFVLPIISEFNYREAMRQNRLISYKNRGIKITKKIRNDIQKMIDDRIESTIILGRSYGTCFMNCPNRIFVNLRLIFREFDDSTVLSPEQKVCETISHEIIHYAINKLEGNDVSSKYDNIKEELRERGYRYS